MGACYSRIHITGGALPGSKPGLSEPEWSGARSRDAGHNHDPSIFVRPFRGEYILKTLYGLVDPCRFLHEWLLACRKTTRLPPFLSPLFLLASWDIIHFLASFKIRWKYFTLFLFHPCGACRLSEPFSIFRKLRDKELDFVMFMFHHVIVYGYLIQILGYSLNSCS